MPGDPSFINRIRSQFRRATGRPEHVLSRSLLDRVSAQAEPRMPPQPARSRSWVKPPHVAWRRLLSWGQGNAPVHGGYEQSPYAYREEQHAAAGGGANWKSIAYVLTVLLVVVTGSFAYVLMSRNDDGGNSPMLALQTATGTIANDGTLPPAAASAPAATSARPSSHSTQHARASQPTNQPPIQPTAQPVQAAQPRAAVQMAAATKTMPAQNPVTQPYQPQPWQSQPAQRAQSYQQPTPYRQAQQYQQPNPQAPQDNQYGPREDQPTQSQPYAQGSPYQQAQQYQQGQAPQPTQQQLAMQNSPDQQDASWGRAARPPEPADTKASDDGQAVSGHVAYDLRVARASLDRNNLTAAHAALGRALAAQPHNAEAQRMHADLEDREFQRDSILAGARSCAVQDQWTCVWRDAGKALVIDSSSNEAKTMLTTAMTQSELDSRTGATRVPRPPGAP